MSDRMRNLLALAVLALGLTQLAGKLTGLRVLRGLGAEGNEDGADNRRRDEQQRRTARAPAVHHPAAQRNNKHGDWTNLLFWAKPFLSRLLP